ncbi:lipid A export permease/ATP-binding protein MsbA [Alphaproteobacteria bacterium]|nr:lipid A export permease/ATP-binding protein MsbA [Alphaproteobacteria bacterium]
MTDQSTYKSAAAPHKSTGYMLKRLLGSFVKPYVGTLVIAVICMAIAAAMTASVAFMMQYVLDDVLSEGKKDMILPVACTLMAIFWISGIATYIHTVLMAKVGQSIVADIQKRLFSHFMDLDLTFFHDNPSGQLISRVVNDVQVVRGAISDSLVGVGKNSFTLVFLIGVMFYQDWKLSIAAFTIFPLIALFVAALGRKLRKVSSRTQTEMASLSDRLSQIFQGIRQVKAYGMEQYETDRASAAIESVKKLNIKTVRTGNLSTPVNEMLVGIILFSVIIYGGYQAAEQQMTVGELGSFLAAFMMAYEPMKKLAKLNNTIQTGLGSAERIFDMIDLHPQIQDQPSAKPIKLTKPNINFRDVVFQYEGGETNALDGISFTAEAGKMTALVGRSGGGKSTIINLIPRFYDVSEGEVLIEGQNLKDVRLQSLRQNIALVSQDITIFDDTIAANIAYSRHEASEEDIIRAAKDAAAHEFIMAMPEGYQTQVGEDGVKLSGGQRQRISIARAILRDAPILLLDEATSALDNESEKLVQEALKRLEKGRTTIAIAHRLSTVQSADNIIVLENGKIVEQGAHNQLMSNNGTYKKMVESGLKDE